MRLHTARTALLAALALATPALGQTKLYDVWGFAPGFDFGRSVVAVGDTNGDGGSEYYVSAPGAQGALGGIFGNTFSGTVFLMNGVDGAVLRTINGTDKDDYFGQRLDTIGDIDGDGVEDVLVGAPQALYVPFKSSWQSFTGRGYVQIRSGKTGNVIRTHFGYQIGSAFGMAGAGIGDVTGDGVPDYAVGAPRGPVGEVYVFSGADGALVREESSASNLKRGWGFWIESCGDADGDGVLDHLVSSVPDISLVANAGVTCVSGADGSEIWINAKPSGDESEWGYRTMQIDDLTGDGVPEVVSGAKRANQYVGYAEWMDGASGQTAHQHQGKFKSSTFGASMVYLGDLDGDGIGESAVGTPSEGVPFGYGTRGFQIFSGGNGFQTGFVFAEPLHTFSFGTDFAVADVDGDGQQELIVGSPLEDPAYFYLSGRVEIFTDLTGGSGGPHPGR